MSHATMKGCAAGFLLLVPHIGAGGELQTTAPSINVWYGQSQTFGKLGVPQRRVNILGNVSDPSGIDSFYYRLNGGPRILLSNGPDTRRLSRQGDFNIDIPYASLSSGLNAVQITAKNFSGQTSQSSVSLTAAPPWNWPLPYSVDWSTSQSLTDSSQVVDGRWGVVGDGIEPLEPGYDRLVSIGDTSWTDYEALMEFTVYGIDSTATAFDGTNGGPGFGFLLRWNGHTTTPAFSPPILQPVSGYLPLGAIGWYHWRTGFGSSGTNQWELLGNNSLELKASNPSPAIEYAVRYYLRMHVVTNSGGGLYRVKVWRTDQQEPASWLLTGQETLTGPQHGSLLIVAQHVDVSISTLVVTPINPDNLPPVLSNIQAEPGGTAATVRWDTDEQSSSMVLYGHTSAYGDTVAMTNALTIHHELNLTGLTASSMYHYQVLSSDNLGNRVASGDNTFFTGPLPAPSMLASDDLNDSLLHPVWSFVNPIPPGGSSLVLDGSAARIVVAGGTAHEIWTGGSLAPRIVQSANNTDFDISVKFTSGISGSASSSQSQGMVFEADPNTLIRFDFTTGLEDSTRIFAASFAGGFSAPAVKVNRNITSYNQAPLYLRVKRESNVWTEMYSFDGLQWKVGSVFYYALPITKAGIFAANGGSAPQPFTCLIDEVIAPLPAPVHLVSPVAGATGIPLPAMFSWAQSVNAASYEVQVSPDSTFPGGSVHDSIVTSQSVQLSTLAGTTRYFWRARGINGVGTGPFSTMRSFTTGLLVPAAPLLAAPPDGSSGQPIRPTLRWFRANGASSYWLQVSRDSLFSNVVFNDSTITDSTMSPDTLLYQTTYFWRVKGKNVNGSGMFSQPWKFTTAIQPPDPVVLSSPVNHATEVDTMGLVFRWRKQQNILHYHFVLASDSTFAGGVVKNDSTIVDTFRVVSGLPNKTRFFWHVFATNAGGAGPESAIWDFTTRTPVGVEVTGMLPDAFRLYQNFPNPFNPTTEIAYDIASSSEVTITVHDLLGRSVRHLVSEVKPAGRYRVAWEGTDDMGLGVASGVYLYRLRAGSFVQTKKLVLLR